MSPSGVPQVGGPGLDDVLRRMPAAVVVVDAASRSIVYANDRARQMVEQQLGKAIPPTLTEDWEIFHVDGRPYGVEEWPLVRSLSAGEEILDEEYFNVRPDGTRLIVSCSSSPIYGDDRSVVGGVLVMRDLTEQKLQEERLTYLGGLLDNTDDAIVALDAQWFVTVWNAGAERMYGWSADEVVGRHTLEVARLEMSDEERAEVRCAVAEQGRWRGEVVAYRKDGTSVCVELITVALSSAGGEITGYLGIHRDVTARKRAEEALVEAHRQSETILESISDGFVAVDREWRYTYVNERALRRMESRSGRQLTREDVLGQGMWELFPDATNTPLEHHYREAMRERRAIRFETYFAPSDDWIEADAYPSDTGLSIYYRNVSERKRAEIERESRAHQQGVVATLGLRALVDDDLQGLMDEAVGLVAQTLDVELVGVAEMAPGGEEIIFRSGFGWQPDVLGRRLEQVTRDSVLGYTLRVREPVIVEDMSSDTRFTASVIMRDHGAVSALSVMIESQDEPFGTLGVFSTRPRTFSTSDVSFVQSVANVLAGAVERSRTQNRLIEVRDAERRRIARDLHDEALQELAHAIALSKHDAAAGGRDPTDELTGALERVREQLRGAIYDLRLGGEQETRFPELLHALVAVHRVMAPRCEIELDVGPSVPTGPLGGRGIDVLRILGEALTNARRHAQASRVRVRVWRSEAGLHAEVSDDGRGFDPGDHPPSSAGRGITGMRERAALLDAHLDILSDPQAGTTIRLEVASRTLDQGAAERVRVLLVEDHTAVLQAIAAMFEREPDFTVVGRARSLAEARELLRDVDVALLDLGLPDGDGADLIAELREASPGAQALVLSADLDRAQAARAIERGAAAALDKTAHLHEIVDAVRRLRAGQTLLSPDEIVQLLRFAGERREQERGDRAAIASLTAREREVLQALGAGLDSRAIADQLYISIRTQRNHVARILNKLGVHSQLQAVLLALRYGAIDAP
jgi:PAS domain S-box-containing protein